MDASLEKRFISFLAGVEGSEDLDRVLASNHRRADFLLNNRKIIVEIKSLEADPEGKVRERLKEYESRPDFPSFFWKVQLEEVLDRLPDGAEIGAAIYHAITRSVQHSFEKADKQIAATRAALQLHDSFGLLVLLNERIGVLDPETLTAKVSAMMGKKKGGGFRYKEISYAWIIAESHTVPVCDGSLGVVSVLVEGPSAEAHVQAVAMLDDLLLQWSNSQNMPFLNLGKRDGFDDLPLRRRDQDSGAKSRPLSNHELWRQQYRREPYLRDLNGVAFRRYAAALVVALRSGMTVEGKVPANNVQILMVGWAHALEEAEHRRLDMKELGPYIKELSDSVPRESR